MRMKHYDIKTFLTIGSVVKSLLISGIGALVGSVLFAVIDSYTYLDETYYIVLKFLISIMLSIFPAMFGGFILVIIAQTLKPSCRRRKIMRMAFSGGGLGIILGFLLCIFVDTITNHRMPIELFYFRMIIVVIISLLIGGTVGGYIATYER